MTEAEVSEQSSSRSELAEFVRCLPKVELHCHLEGSVPASTFISLAQRHGVELPTDDPDHVYDFGSFLEFLDLYYLVCRAVRDEQDFERAVHDSLAHGVQTSNLRYREMFFSPTNHELPYADMVRGITAGIESAEAQFGVRCRMIADINRRQTPARALELVDAVIANPSPYVVGIGMDDDEDSGPASWFVEAFDRAGAAGLKRTAHAGEMGNPRNILDSLDLLGCDRIDHGYAMVGEPEVMHRVRESGVHITGAWYVNLFQSGILFDGRDPAVSPLAAMVLAGLPVSINSDDPTMIPTDLTTEYLGVAQALGLDREHVVALVWQALDGAWLDETSREVLRAEMRAEIDALVDGTSAVDKNENALPSDGVTIDDRAITDPDVFERLEHHELFTRLRAEDPVHWTEDENGPGFWSITKHADLKIINRDAEGFSSEANGVNLVELDGDNPFDMRGKIMLMTDPPRHTRYRLLVNKGFTPRMIGLIEQHLRYRTELIVDEVIESGECEFVTDLAAELPLQAIAEIMGVPDEDRHLLFNWSNRMVGADDPEYQSDNPDEATSAVMELYMYAAGLGELRRADPKDDVVTKLINAEIDGDHLTQEEFELFILLLAVAGNETTRNATAHGMIALMEHPEELAKLRSDPDRYIDGAVEEILRWATPVMHFRRTAMKDLELRGKVIKAGDKVVMWHISANRDEEVFDDPFLFDIERTPNDHIAFGGGGAHFCLGTNLARMELRLIFHEVVSRLNDVEFDGDIERLRSNFIGGVKHIPIRFTPGERKHPVGSSASV